ncbi:Rab family GTPase [Cochleicola gelatinilyticus]|uniref:GTP-binding protein n=1 Tax=Cochleicola gelatinilyticus TaxID=1763537 RepID=A0A167J827_9FLAO|nr:Rab family GTPase [Cochleicola gelatinilyticus]OAB80414.1 GTP-binding protein [Cochleicola gelatinilyticus]
MESTKKIVLLGQFGVGKTSLLRRFITDEFSKAYKTTLGVQIKKKTVELPSGKIMSMIIWDLEGFSSVTKTRASYLFGASAFIHVFDLTRPATYQNLEEEIAFIKSKYPKVLLKTVGNKCDEKTPNDFLEYIKDSSVEVQMYTSAKTGEGVNELFMEIAKKLKHND